MRLEPPPVGTQDRSALRGAFLLVLASLLAKLAILAFVYPGKPGIVLSPDTVTYVKPALSLLRAASFSPRPEVAPEPELNRTPGYPAIVALLYGAFGERPIALALANVLFSAGTLFLVFLLGRRLFGERVGLVATLLLALEPSSFHYSLVALTETPFTFFTLLGLLLLARVDADARRPAALAALGGLALAAGTLVRPVSYYLLPVLAALLAVRARPGRRRKAVSAIVGAFLAPCVLLVGGWQVRNLARAGTSRFTVNQDVELYLMRAGAVQALAEGAALSDVQKRIGWAEVTYRFGYAASEREAFGEARYADVFPETARLPVPELARVYARRGRDILLAHPFLTLRMQAQGLLFLVLSPPNVLWQYQWGGLVPDAELFGHVFYPRPVAALSWLARRAPLTFALALLCLVLLATLAALALRGLWRSGPRGPHHLAAATLFYLAAVTAGPSCLDDRYRVPLMPLACLFAARGLLAPSPR